MKKYLLLLTSAALLLAGCAKEQIVDQREGGLTNVTFTASLDNGVATKAVADGDGAAASVNRCIMEIYYGDDLYARRVAKVTDKQATFSAQVPSNRTYTVAFWADKVDDATTDTGLATDKYYTTSSLKTIALNGSYLGNDDARDAFFVCKPYEVKQGGSAFTATLKRPFAQVNVITTDWDKVASISALKPEKVNVTLKNALVAFNAVTGMASGSQTLTYEAAVYTPAAHSAEKTLSMDYLFASDTKALIDIDWKAQKTGDDDVKHAFAAVPYQRNYRTNIKGALLTTTGQWTVTVDPEWNQPDENVTFVEAGSVAAANEAFANGATSVKITSVGDETTLYLPQTTEGVTIDFANPSEAITVSYGPAPTKAAGEKPATVNIATNDITKFTVAGISNIVWLAGNQAALANALANAKSNHTVALSNDITMSGQWTPATTNGYTVDGRNHVISNMTITDCGKDYAGLISFMSGGVVKNITVKDANIVYNSGSSARGGAIVGISYGGTIENCHAENVSIKGYQKMGGIVGYLAQSGNGFVVRNCSAKNISFTNNTTDLTYQAGGIVGYTLNYNGDILVEGCSVSDITINNQYDGSEGANLPYYCGTFIGSLDNQAAKEGLKIELKNNTISGTNTPQIDQMYANTYFGWANNNECTLKSQSYFATILIDGEEWTPNYPVKIVGGKGYATLAEALTAATEGQTVQILKAGDYTVQTLSTKAAVVEATVEGVVFNRTASGSITSYGNTDPVTVKNITWKVGSTDFQYFNCACENCTIDGRICAHTMVKLTNCTLKNTYAPDYCVWTYASPCIFEGCTFESQGKFVNVYGVAGTVAEVKATNCNFVNLKQSVYKAAFNIKGNGDGKIQHAHVVIDNCTTEGLFPDHNTTDGQAIFFDGGLIMFDDPAWEDDVYAVVDGITYYPYFTIDANGNYSVNSANGLKKAIAHWNKLTSAGEKTITVANGTYEVSDMVIAQNVSGKSLTIKAATAKGVTLKVPATSLYPYIFMVNGCSTYDETRAITFNGFKFDVSAITDKSVAPVMNMSSKEDYSNLGYPKASSGHANDYGGYITIDNCELIGGNGSRNDNAAMYLANSGASPKNITVQNSTLAYAGYLLATYVNGFTAKNVVTTTPIKHFINNQTGGVTVDGCTVECNTDYAVRSSAGPVSITNSVFTMTYTGTETGGIYVDRGANTQVTMSGNTYPASYAGANMHDVYNEKNGTCTINGSITLNNEEFYDFPR